MSNKTTGIINKPSASKINWITGVGTVVAASVNAAAQVGFVDQGLADNVNQLIAIMIPPIVFVLRSYFTVKEI